MIGACVYTASMETGEKWLLNDVAGTQLRVRNSREIQQSTSFGKLRRPITSRVRSEDGAEFTAQTFSYGEDQTEPEAHNLRGKLYQIRDQALVSITEAYDHLRNPIRGAIRLVKEYKRVVDWRSSVEMEDEEFTSSSTFDALGRLLSKARADGSFITNAWNQQGLLTSVQAAGSPTANGPIINEIQYNARGQRVLVSYGNGIESRFEYDPNTFIMVSKKTLRAKASLQDLQYTMDCVGKIVRINDLAQQDIFFRGEVVKPTKEFSYDAIGRLTNATGREHLGQIRQNWTSIPSSSASGASREASPSDGKAMANYIQEYTYSPEGNILSVAHSLADKTVSGWTRTYQYNEPSLLESHKHNNHLSSTTVGDAVSTIKYEGPSGRVGLTTSMSGFSVLKWDFLGHLEASVPQVVTNGGTPETSWYRYDSNNQRVRKVTERFAGPGETPVRMKDHLHVNGAEIEIFRKYDSSGSAVTSERWSWHIKASDARAVLVEASKGLDGKSDFEDVVSRYMVYDHTSSVGLELDDTGNVVSIEEFAPYGATTYDATANLKVSKRYRFSAKERDSETGLYYFENRYLMPWLGRWLSPDPIGTQDGLNVYCYVSCDPINKVDPTGLNEFVLIRIGGNNTVKTLSGGDLYDPSTNKPFDQRNSYFWDKFRELRSYIKANGSCELVMKYSDPYSGDTKVSHVQNTPLTRHAEENVFYSLSVNTVKIEAILIVENHGNR
jgi:RHS repeat-associated protein